MIHSKETIAAALLSAADDFQKVFSEEELKARHQPESWFVTSPAPGKWTPGQHLDHLIKSVEPLNLAFGWAPRFYLRWQYGTPNRVGRSFDEIVRKYSEKLLTKNPVNNPFSSEKVEAIERARLLQRFDNQHVKLTENLKSWSENDLDSYLLPHPLLGKVTLREMLFFTVHHIAHHRQIVQK